MVAIFLLLAALRELTVPAADGLPLHVVVVPATGDKTLPPVYWLDGGPGIDATASAGFWQTDGAIHLRHRDLVLIDQRGTGKSAPLACPEVRIGDPFVDTLDLAAVVRCREGLQRDLSRFSTAQAVADIDSVRAALGHERIDLAGLSYGTRVAQEYLRAHADRVRAAALLGSLPPEVKLPLPFAKTAWATLTRLVPAPEIAAADAAVPAAQRGRFWEWVRGGMAIAPFQRELRGLLRKVAQGHAAEVIQSRKPVGFDGLLLSVSCPEDTLHIAPEEIASAAGGVFGTYRVAQQVAACKAWGVPPRDVPRDFVKAPTPVLLMAGEMDSITPPEWSDAIAARMPHARVVRIAGLGHFPDGLSHMECYDQIIAAFFEAGSADRLDLRCLSLMH
ncbi:MAG TPA: alpha/beta fold hydrolase [Myxococcales bacterium]|nr:alpha/beta fold hydrolase [Myxococcales bacterium]